MVLSINLCVTTRRHPYSCENRATFAAVGVPPAPSRQTSELFYNPVPHELEPNPTRSFPIPAPREDRAALIEPPFDGVPGLVAENIRNQNRLHDYDLQGHSLAEISLLARRELLAAARRWTGAYRNIQDKAKGTVPFSLRRKLGSLRRKLGQSP